MKNIKRFSFVLTILSVVLGVLSVTAPANADGGTTITAEAHASSMDDATVSATTQAAVIVNTNAEGKIVGAWAANPGPKGHWNPTKARKVPFVKSYNKGVASCKPFRLKKGKWMPRTLKRRDGVFFQVQGGTRVKYAWSLFDQGKSCSDVRHRGYYNPRTHKWVGDCVNPKPTPNMPTYPPSMVVEVKQHTAIDYELDLAWQASAWVYGSVTVTCPKSSATSSFKAMGSTNGSLKLRISARSRAEAEAKGRQQIELMVKNSIAIRADIMGSGEVSAEGTAKASCTDVPDQPTMTLSLDKPNDVDQSVATPGEPIDWSFTPTYGHAVAPSGEGDVTYTVDAEYGFVKFITANSPCETNGLRDNVVTTITKPSGTYDLALCYIASTESPSSYGGSDTITLSAVFAGKTYTDSKSITVNPTPPHPL